MQYQDIFNEGKTLDTVGGSLVEQFGIPPFSVLDARSGAWQARKAAWLSLGIKSELGRGENLLRFSDTVLQPDAKKRAERVAVVKGQGWGGGVQRRDPAFYEKKREWEKRNGREISTTEFREKYWDGYDEPKQRRAIPGGETGKNSAWMFKTEEGYRSGKVLNGEPESSQTGTSIFDPVLCELFYRWFVPKEGTILDPFAGGSVRGVIAGRLGYHYNGIDIRQEQVDENRKQAKLLCKYPLPTYKCEDARNVLKVQKTEVDALFTCPPYVNLEIYSDDARDISKLEWKDFQPVYEQIVRDACDCLKPNRFAGIVVGEVRDKRGMCVGFVPGTIDAFRKAGLTLYNDAILLTAIGSLSIRTGRQFAASRKFGRTHQHVLVFLKGDPKKAVAALGDDV